MLNRLVHFIKGPNLFHPNVWKGRLQPTTFRLMALTDIPRCVEIYSRNEPGRFPADGGASYQADLESGTSCTIVAERDQQVVATAGISKVQREDVVVLSLGWSIPPIRAAAWAWP